MSDIMPNKVPQVFAEKPGMLSPLGLASSEMQIPQVVENLESEEKSGEALETVALRVKQAL